MATPQLPPGTSAGSSAGGYSVASSSRPSTSASSAKLHTASANAEGLHNFILHKEQQQQMAVAAQRQQQRQQQQEMLYRPLAEAPGARSPESAPVAHQKKQQQQSPQKQPQQSPQKQQQQQQQQRGGAVPDRSDRPSSAPTDDAAPAAGVRSSAEGVHGHGPSSAGLTPASRIERMRAEAVRERLPNFARPSSVPSGAGVRRLPAAGAVEYDIITGSERERPRRG